MEIAWNRLRMSLVVGFLTSGMAYCVLLIVLRLDPRRFLSVSSFLLGFPNEPSRTFSTTILLYGFLVFPVVVAYGVYSLFEYFSALSY
jgi:hypothetical protein